MRTYSASTRQHKTNVQQDEKRSNAIHVRPPFASVGAASNARMGVQEMADNSPQVAQMKHYQNMVNQPMVKADGMQSSAQVAQLEKKNKNKQLWDDYESEMQDDQDAEQDVEDELWSDDSDVIKFAFKELQKYNYTGWDDTDSSQGNYCRFIWYLRYNVKVGVNVHYPAGGGKAAGHMYIEGIQGWQNQTPQVMVDNAPANRPPTTARWR